MSFGDGIMLLGIELTAKQVEDAAADLKDYPIPVHCISSFYFNFSHIRY